MEGMGSDRIEPGVLLAERFRIASFVGSGGMGRVYRAVDVTSGDVVALKVLLAGGPNGAQLFSCEIAALARVSHPRIVRYVSHGTSPEGPFLAMEWLEGEDLRQRLAGNKRLGVAEVVALGVHLAEALAHAHARGI